MGPSFKVFLLLSLAFVSAEPQPEPEPQPLADAEAEAQAQADPQFSSYGSAPVMRPMAPVLSSPGCGGGGGGTCGGGSTGFNPGGSISPEILPAPVPVPGGGGGSGYNPGVNGGSGYNPGGGGGSCGLQEQCCNMADSGCCVGGAQPQQQQKCYTVWETKCRYASKQRCRQTTREHCQRHPIKSCRRVTETKNIVIPLKKCTPQTKRTCFDYPSKSCKMSVNNVVETINWTNENLLGGTESKEMCQTVRTCDLVEREDSRTIRVPRQQCDNVPYTRKKCGSSQVPQAPIEVPTMEYRTEYKQQCYNVPKPVCRMEPCTYQVKQAPVCPTCINGSPGPDCNTQAGLCGGGGGGGAGSSSSCGGGSCGGGMRPPQDMCGACRQQNVQMCTRMTQKCDMVNEQVCQQVPVRVPVPGKKMVPQPPRWEMKCEDITENRQQCKTVYEEKTVRVPVKECNQGTTRHCENYEVPKQEVQSTPESGTVTIAVENCDIVEEEKQYCTDVPTEVLCTNTTMSKTVRYQRVVCDRQNLRPYCKQFPESNCENMPGQQCEQVPRQVCQPSCVQSSYCNMCAQFASQGGFQSQACQTPTCANFISSSASSASSCQPGQNCQ